MTIPIIFQIFSLVHRVIKDQKRLKRIVQETLEDFESNNCVYLELRTTPKPLQDLTKVEYIQTIENVIREYKGKMKTRLLVSINRAQSLEEAWENLQIAKNSELCVGLDFSGNPGVNKFKDFWPVFLEAKNSGIHITVHTAEIEDHQDTDNILEFKPDRLGHCNFLTEQHENTIKQFNIPIEICLSSNVLGLGIKLEDHHFRKLFRQGFKLAICTDDTLMFETNLNKEFFIVQQEFQLGLEELKEICRESAKMAFSEGVEDLLGFLNEGNS